MSKIVKKEVVITSEIKKYSCGKFAQSEDPFKNMIALWEPYIEVYEVMIHKEINDFFNQ